MWLELQLSATPFGKLQVMMYQQSFNYKGLVLVNISALPLFNLKLCWNALFWAFVLYCLEGKNLKPSSRVHTQHDFLVVLLKHEVHHFASCAPVNCA